MERYYIFKDGQMMGIAATEEAVLDMIRTYQAKETHPLLRAEFSYIKGVKVSVEYE